uniref:2,3-bisphosphoglycerate-independent phosphoglycerate mutase n=1 Tax=Fundidesulfovibrio putealis TaxID=270496 RepID=A0A7C4AHY1_9BACT
MARKILFLVADGMGGWPGEVDQATAMEAAATPQMDDMARKGLVGLARTIPPGMPPGSDVANMALLGFDPAAHHTGRGPIEAAAQGLELAGDDLVWRCNLVSVTDFSERGLMLDYSSGHISSEASRPLVDALDRFCASCSDDFAPFKFHKGVQYRHLLVQKAGASGLEADISIRPPHDITDQPIAQDVAAFKSSPLLWSLTRCAARFLAGEANATKANAIWPWGQGRALKLPAFGMKGAVVSAVDLIKGLGRAAGMDVLEVEGATGLLDTNYEGKVQAAIDYLKKGDFAFVHLEGPDECGHGGDAAGKAEAIARFDSRVVKPLREAFPDALFLITCDHLTPIARRTHVDDPVPFLLYGSGVPANGAASFSEAQAAATGLRIDPGHALLAWALKQAGGA